MATGPEHYRNAEVVLAQARDLSDLSVSDWQREQWAREAQVHATLALAAATAAGANMMHADQIAWERVSGASLDIDGQQR